MPIEKRSIRVAERVRVFFVFAPVLPGLPPFQPFL
jgi:hypothetical protein